MVDKQHNILFWLEALVILHIEGNINFKNKLTFEPMQFHPVSGRSLV